MDRSVALLTFVEAAVMLNPGDAQARKARPVNGPLPGREFFERELIAIACLIDRQEPAIHGCHNLTFATDDPTGSCGRRECFQRKGLTKGANDLRGPEFLVLDHLTPVIADRLGGRASVGEE